MRNRLRYLQEQPEGSPQNTAAGKAVARYKAGDFAGALAELKALADNPDLSF
jgi:hypothetical protein